ncbi:Fe-S cluster assembly ATPase SufC [Patescibacteria group bacterium]|nr:Fe-S cluster assembly ATPase SufC [Patescibacteria group bacterium]
MLKIKNLKVNIENKEILKGVILNIKEGEIICIMGPNGSGKSSLASTIMGNQKYRVKSGEIIYKKNIITKTSVNHRASAGIFLAHQNPSEIFGVDLISYLFEIHKGYSKAKNIKALSVFDFNEKVKVYMKDLQIDDEFLQRSLNFGLSGGEKKKIEILQMLILQPELIILDEIDSGLDVDALKLIARVINKYFDAKKAILIITHSKKILSYIKPTRVAIMKDGRIQKSGDSSLVALIEKKGFNNE